MLEVELKFPLPEEASFCAALASLGAIEGETVTQADEYFNHPSRDFATTDEALRLRRVGDDSVVTYKGPKQGTLAKSRLEVELPLAADTVDGLGAILRQLSFRSVAVVKKQRRRFHLERGGRAFEISIDRVEGLGSFAEVETLAEEGVLQEAERAVLALAAELGLTDAEPWSYLEMLLAD